ncbi:unnamed protein product [Pleuronectes platessa]|uniref:Uncharacterized protein n=1 Tax=Pleuronectes platessa TaxID=8262 RepID=A0A9N7TQ88_PLEPL|nr:unnamed protein product [Pleuronectes platessa]
MFNGVTNLDTSTCLRKFMTACSFSDHLRGNGLRKAVDLVCDDYGIVNAPFSGTLVGPVSRNDRAGNQYEGVKNPKRTKQSISLCLYLGSPPVQHRRAFVTYTVSVRGRRWKDVQTVLTRGLEPQISPLGIIKEEY